MIWGCEKRDGNRSRLVKTQDVRRLLNSVAYEKVCLVLFHTNGTTDRLHQTPVTIGRDESQPCLFSREIVRRQ